MAEPRRLSSAERGFEEAFARLIAFEAAQDDAVERATTAILDDVRARGDAALLELTARFDRWKPASAAALEVPLDEAKRAAASLAGAEREALQTAAERIRRYHERQRQSSWRIEEEDGTMLGQQVTPIDRVGLYVPGGKAAYPSSVLMCAIAAKTAGVRELVMVTPTPDGALKAVVLAAAALAGVDRILRIGGAQAIAALAFGTATVPAVDKIVGPGNAYVAAAKRRVFGTVGIDMIAGPSEILVVADAQNDPAWIAADLLSQCEHDTAAQAILITDDAKFADDVARAAQTHLRTLPRAAIAGESWERHGAIITAGNWDEAVGLVDRIAPE